LSDVFVGEGKLKNPSSVFLEEDSRWKSKRSEMLVNPSKNLFARINHVTKLMDIPRAM
jgi:hypothetical protein